MALRVGQSYSSVQIDKVDGAPRAHRVTATITELDRKNRRVFYTLSSNLTQSTADHVTDWDVFNRRWVNP